MSDNDLSQSRQGSQIAQQPYLRRYRWLFYLTAGLLIFLVIVTILQIIYLRGISNRIELLEWSNEYKDLKLMLGNSISPESNSIQFLDNGYSIELEHVIYEPAGLHLIGYFGNPKLVTLHSVSLKFSARKSPSIDDYRKAQKQSSDYIVFRTPEEIGSAQTSAMSIVLPGTRSRFEVTIPNVRQTKAGLRLYVSLSGVRYSYVR
jgi:hypothetical protein